MRVQPTSPWTRAEMRRWSPAERAEVFAAPDVSVTIIAARQGSYSAFGAGLEERQHPSALAAVRALMRRLETR